MMHRCLTGLIGVSLILFSAICSAGNHVDGDFFAGSRARVVWLQDYGDGRDVLTRGNRLKLMGWDSADPKGEREILPETGPYRKPLLGPSGDRIVFSLPTPNRVMVVDWNGGGLRTVGEGIAVDFWKDPSTGHEWIYAARNPRPTDSVNERFAQIVRIRLDSTDQTELVWDKTLVGIESFQISADGTRAAATFPWPDTGLAVLPNGSYQQYGRGCWTSLSPDNSYLMWMFDGQHRNLILHTEGNRRSWRIPITGAPGAGGHEVYHPRWTNHPAYFAMTGPYTIQVGTNNIRGGGTGVEVYLGRFSDDMQRVEKWTRITHNDKADFFPDAWIEGGESRSLAPLRWSNPNKSEGGQILPKPSSPLQVHARLLEKSHTPTPESIAPYPHALSVYRYELLAAAGGLPVGSQILVAHWVIRDRLVIPEFSRTIGENYIMTVENMTFHPELESERTIQDMDAWDLPLFIDMSG